MRRQLGDRGFRREVLQREDAEAVLRVENVGAFGVGALAGGEDGETGVVAFAVAAAVGGRREEEERVDPIAQFGG